MALARRMAGRWGKTGVYVEARTGIGTEGCAADGEEARAGVSVNASKGIDAVAGVDIIQ